MGLGGAEEEEGGGWGGVTDEWTGPVSVKMRAHADDPDMDLGFRGCVRACKVPGVDHGGRVCAVFG